MKKTISLLVIIALICNSCKSWNRTQKGAVIGTGAGAATGAAIGKAANDHTLLGAIIGAAVGGAAGAVIGRYMDKQADEISKDVQGAKVERIGEAIKITFDTGILFDVNSSTLKPEALENVTKLAHVLAKYEDTDVLIEGHTDNTGDDKYNQELSEKRAGAVSNSLKIQGTKGSRITTMGYGESQPIQSNETADGRALNRRVEVAIMADKKLKRAAKKGDIG